MAKYRKSRIHKEEQEPSFDVDLSPLLALMVTLIPIMLLATVFVKVSVIETPIPQAVEKALNKDRNKKKRVVNVHIYMKSNKKFNVVVDTDGRKSVDKIIKSVMIHDDKLNKQTRSWDFKSLHKEIVGIKKIHPKVFRLKLYPDEAVPYSNIVKVMDEVRETQKGDQKIYILDEKTKKQVESKLMFPDVIFSNIMEG